MSSGGGENPAITLMFGALVLVFVLGGLHGFSTIGALMAIPILLLQTLFLSVGYLFSILTAFTLGSALSGPFAIITLILVWMLIKNGIMSQYSPQNYVTFAVFILLILLLV